MIHSLNRGFAVRNSYVQNNAIIILIYNATTLPPQLLPVCLTTYRTHSSKLRLLLLLVILPSSSYSILIIPRGSFQVACEKNWGSFGVVFRLILGIIWSRGSFRVVYKSDSTVDGEPQGNWIWNSNSRDVVASSPSFSLPAARAPRRACSQATLNLACSRLRDVCLFLSRLRAWNRLPWTWGSDA